MQVKLQPGLLDMLAFLHTAGLQRAILTRNAPFAVDDFVARVQEAAAAHGDAGVRDALAPTADDGGAVPQPLFHTVLTRDFTPCKPHPAPIVAICEQWGLHPHGMWPTCLWWGHPLRRRRL